MATQEKKLLAFNRGVISSRGLARVDLKRMAMSAETQRNWMARVLGSMMIRPGFEFIDRTASDATRSARQIPFTFGVDDTAQLELTEVNLRVRIDDVLISRPAVTTAVSNGGFGTDLTDWTDNDEAGATSSWTGGKLSLVGTGENGGESGSHQRAVATGGERNTVGR